MLRFYFPACGEWLSPEEMEWSDRSPRALPDAVPRVSLELTAVQTLSECHSGPLG